MELKKRIILIGYLREVLSSIPLELKAILYIKVLKIKEKMQIVMSWKIIVLNKL